MKVIHTDFPSVLRPARGLLVAGMAAIVLAGCFRNEPTPDPPPAPPTPQTMMEELRDIEPGIYPAIYIFPESEIPDRRNGQVRVAT